MFALFKSLVAVDFQGKWNRQLQRLGRIFSACFITAGFPRVSLSASQFYLCLLHLSAHLC